MKITPEPPELLGLVKCHGCGTRITKDFAASYWRIDGKIVPLCPYCNDDQHEKEVAKE